MPNKTIYVSDEDKPVFERAQTLTGRNLSATIVEALRHFTQQLDLRSQGFNNIEIEVGEAVIARKRFIGRLLATAMLVYNKRRNVRSIVILGEHKRGKLVGTRNIDSEQAPSDGEKLANERYNVYQTPKGNLVLHVEITPAKDSTAQLVRRMEVFATLDEIKDHIPQDLYDCLSQKLKGNDTEVLDI